MNNNTLKGRLPAFILKNQGTIVTGCKSKLFNKLIETPAFI